MENWRRRHQEVSYSSTTFGGPTRNREYGDDKRKRIAEEIKTAETRQVQALSDVEEMILGVRAVNR